MALGGMVAGLAGGASASAINIVIRAHDAYSAELKKAEKAANKLGTEFNKTSFIASKLGTVGLVAVGAALAGFAVASVRAAVELEPIKRGFEDLAKNSGTFLKELELATEGTVKQFDLMKAANNALLLGIDQDKLPGMFKAAAIIGQAAGRTTTEALNDITLGIARQSRLILDNIGIIVVAETAYKKFAEANNIVGRSLTDVEKKLAFQAEATFQAIQKAEELGGVLEQTFTFQMDRAKKNINDLMVDTGDSISDPGSDILKFFNDWVDILKDLNEEDKKRRGIKIETEKKGGVTPLDALFGGEGGITGALKRRADEQTEERLMDIRSSQEAQEMWNKAFMSEAERTTELNKQNESIRVQNDKIKEVVDASIQYNDIHKQINEQLSKGNPVTAEMNKQLTDSFTEMERMKQVLIETYPGLALFGDELIKLATKTDEATKKISKSWGDMVGKIGIGDKVIQSPDSPGGSSGHVSTESFANKAIMAGQDTYGSSDSSVRTAYGQAAAAERRAMQITVNIDGANHTKSNQVAKT